MQNTIPLNSFPGANALLLDYVDDFNKVARWFHYNARDEAAFAARMGELKALGDVDRTQAVEAVIAQQIRWGAGDAAVAASRLTAR